LPVIAGSGRLYSNAIGGGNLIKYIALILLFAFAASLTTSSAVADTRDCGLKQYASIDLEESANGHLLVPVTIDGTDTLMLLNTNTLTSTLTDTAVSRLSLKTHASSLRVEKPTGQSYIAQIATVKTLAIGRVQLQNKEFIEYPASSLSSTAERDYADKRVVGIIGMNILAHVDIELDIAHHKMNLYSQHHCPGQVVYWSHAYDSVPIHLGPQGEVYFPIELDGKKIEATFSTFQATTTLTTDVTRKLYDFDNNSPDVESEIDASGKTIAHYRAMQLDAVGFKIVNAQITLSDPRSGNCHLGTRFGAAAYEGCFANPPLALGLNVLKKLHVYIATKEKILYLTLADISDQH